MEKIKDKMMSLYQGMSKSDRIKFDMIYRAFTNHGVVDVSSLRDVVTEDSGNTEDEVIKNIAEQGTIALDIKDVLSRENWAAVTGYTISVLMAQAIEPELLVTNLFTKIQDPGMQLNSIEVYVPDELTVYELDRNSVRPTPNPQMRQQTYKIRLDTRRYGVFLQFEEEYQDLPINWDLVSIWLKQASKALARHKEKLAISKMLEDGMTLYNNADTTSAVFHEFTRGRDIEGRKNGTMSPRDFMRGYAHLMSLGHTPDTVIMHPYAWQVFLFSPMTREILMNGNVVQPDYTGVNVETQTFLPNMPFGNLGLKGIFGNVSPDDLFGKIGAALLPAVNNPWVLNPLTTRMIYRPNWMPNGMNFIITPYISWEPDGSSLLTDVTDTTSATHNLWAKNGDTYTGLGEDGSVVSGDEGVAAYVNLDAPVTDIVMCDSGGVGFIYQKQPPTPREWNDPMRDILNMKIVERYGFATAYQGQAIGVFKNIAIDEQYVADLMSAVTLTAGPRG